IENFNESLDGLIGIGVVGRVDNVWFSDGGCIFERRRIMNEMLRRKIMVKVMGRKRWLRM
ncbi:hypothetical protein, partial [Paenibacillus xylanexedens]|uniref:hypothetical protein n=1 Tax=Paenibacillus xylanexedens TaxID=528191 RepID=UPI0016430AF9